MPAVTIFSNPKRRGSWTAFCKNGGCQFLVEHLSKKDAERFAVSHMNVERHETSIVDMAGKREPKTNPGRGKKIGVLSYGAIEIRYWHAEDGLPYKHSFKKGVTIELYSDGSARLFREDGKPVWDDL